MKAVQCPFTPEEISVFRSILLGKREATLDEIDNMRKQLYYDTEQSGHDRPFGTHPAESAVTRSDREKLSLLIARQQMLVSRMNSALDRIEKGTFGICKQTGLPISRDRLSAIPYTELSIEAQRQADRKVVARIGSYRKAS